MNDSNSNYKWLVTVQLMTKEIGER